MRTGLMTVGQDENGVPKVVHIDKFYTSDEWRELRQEVVARDLRQCQYCGGPGNQADHVIPRHLGGPDTLDNLVCACRLCNGAAWGRKFASFEAKQRYIAMKRGFTPKKKNQPIVAPPTVVFSRPEESEPETPAFLTETMSLRDRLRERNRKRWEAEGVYHP
jgi:hypothetical protein